MTNDRATLTRSVRDNHTGNVLSHEDAPPLTARRQVGPSVRAQGHADRGGAQFGRRRRRLRTADHAPEIRSQCLELLEPSLVQDHRGRRTAGRLGPVRQGGI
ncbi:MAG: hypothetical protein QOE59_4858, partial [Actinomycetota bacterium]|nr:hypothetical protein [Actinomycetota bacterium]